MDDFAAVLEAACRGNPDALTTLYRWIHPRILRYLRARDPAGAEDVASEVWLDVAAGLRTFGGDEAGFRAWSFTIARRRLVDARRRAAARPQVPLDDPAIGSRAPRGDVEREALDELGTEEAIALVRRLPEEQADVVMLRIVGGFSVDEVAAIVGKRPGTVRVIQHRALKRLAREAQQRGVTR
ncbi:MAG: RNA polymerase sigma factor [Actinomycetota bacterium]